MRRLFTLAATAALVVGARGQDGGGTRGSAAAQANPLGAATAAAPPESAITPQQKLELAEDAEIFGTLLHGSIRRFYESRTPNRTVRTTGMSGAGSGYDPAVGRGLQFLSASGGKTAGDGRLSQPTSVSLPGYGVVFQLTAPAVTTEKRSARSFSKECLWLALSNWERARRQLRPPADNRSCLQCHAKLPGDVEGGSPPGKISAMGTMKLSSAASRRKGRSLDELTGQLADFLAANGHNVRHLATGERLAVAITLRRTAASMNRSASGLDFGGTLNVKGYLSRSSGQMSAGAGGGDDDDTAYRPGLGAGAPGASGGGGIGSGIPAGGNLELAGDLHAKRGRYDEAAKAYEKAFLAAKDLTDPYNTATLRIAAKLVEVYLKSANYQAASRWLKALESAPSQKPASARRRSGRLPARLTVSATREQLIAVHAGKLSGDAFRKALVVEYFDPAATEAGGSAKGDVMRAVVVNVIGELVQISAGAHDGIRTGQKVSFIREAAGKDAAMIGSGTVQAVAADQSVARIDKRHAGGVKRGDRVVVESPPGKSAPRRSTGSTGPATGGGDSRN